MNCVETFIKFGQALPIVGKLAHFFIQFNFSCNSLVHDPAHDICTIVLRNNVFFINWFAQKIPSSGRSLSNTVNVIIYYSMCIV